MKRLERRFALGVVLSVVAHGLLIAYVHMPKPDLTAPSAPAGPLTVQLTPPKAPKTDIAEAPAAPAQPTPPRVRPPKAPVIAVPREIPRTTIPVPIEPPPPPEPARQEPPAMSFSDLVNARRSQRAPTVSEAAEARARAAGDGRDQSINRNLQTLTQNRDGTSGVFEILNKGPRYASFSFKGWKATNERDAWRQTIEVDAGRGGDVDLAIVRRMIGLIRDYYQGDFNWESRRLGRVVVLSARPQDNAGLEAFLMREFFGKQN
jgi:hypothetical protein